MGSHLGCLVAWLLGCLVAWLPVLRPQSAWWPPTVSLSWLLQANAQQLLSRLIRIVVSNLQQSHGLLLLYQSVTTSYGRLIFYDL